MNRAVTVIGLLCLLLLQGSQAAADSVRDAVEAGNRAFVAAFRKSDDQATAKLYTEDGKVFPPGAPVASGRTAIAAFWKGVIGGGIKDLTLDTDEVESAGDLAYETGTVMLVPATGAATTSRYVVVWKREGGQWKIHRDIWNDAAAAKTAQAAKVPALAVK